MTAEEYRCGNVTALLAPLFTIRSSFRAHRDLPEARSLELGDAYRHGRRAL